jgi:hypothetical protein
MAVRSARGGKADWSATSASGPWTNIPEVRNWNLDPSAPAQTYASSSTGGARRRVEGIEEFSGSISVFVDATAAARFDTDLGIKPGVNGYFRLWEDSGDYFVAPAYVASTPYSVDIEGPGFVEAEINFESDGALVYPA